MISTAEMFLQVIKAKHINAKREKETARAACSNPDGTTTYGAQSDLAQQWEGQEIAFKQLIDIAEGKL